MRVGNDPLGGLDESPWQSSRTEPVAPPRPPARARESVLNNLVQTGYQTTKPNRYARKTPKNGEREPKPLTFRSVDFRRSGVS